MSWFGTSQPGKRRAAPNEKRMSGDYVRHRDEGQDASLPRTKADKDNIRSLDGLRGIACLLVFNYHFLWPWTPSIMLGYGAMLPQAPEPYREWSSLPILCLWQRGRPMVAIFFAISGYVVSRRILRLIHQKRLDVAYQRLASAVFKRAFRLFIPPTISMFLVALMAQVGVFKSNEAIYQGPDSAYINGTITNVTIGKRCYNHTELVVGVTGLIDFMEWQNPLPLGNATVGLCVNSTSHLAGSTSVWANAHFFEKKYARVLNDTTRLTRFENHDYISPYEGPAPLDIVNGTNITYGVPARWVQYGGMWEEHPLIHDNMTYAMANFTRVYAEWVNVFTFNPYHTRYDPHTFTIPMEFRGSMIIYIFLLGTAAIKAKWRLVLAGLVSAYSLLLGRWDVATFMGGTLLSDLDVGLSPSDNTPMPLQPPVTDSAANHRARSPPRRSVMGVLVRWITLVLALYLLSYPDAAAEYTPGFTLLAYGLPRYYSAIAGWSFYEAIGAVMLLPCILRSSLLCRLLEGRVPQYLGKISFSFYLVHGPVLHSLGFWIMPRLFERLGRQNGYLVGYVALLAVSLHLSNWWYRHIDRWSMAVGRRVEQALTV